ncbi:MAG: M1 family metallopeptidase [Candidatus Gallimonas sp.]
MRKLMAYTTAALLIAGLVPIAACAEHTERSRYVMYLDYSPETRTLSARMTLDFYNDTDNALNELKFELYPNAYREGAKYRPVSELYEPAAYYDGESYGNIEIAGVEGAAEYAVCGEDDNILSVGLTAPVYPDERTTLEMNFTTTLARVNHRLGAGENTVNFAHFYPVLCSYGREGFLEYVYAANGDPFVSACADYELFFRLPEEYAAAFGGRGERVAENGTATYHIVSENVRDVALVCGKDMRSRTAQAGDVSVEVVAFGSDPDETTVRAAAESLAFYSRTFGAYPYPRYTVAETDLCAGGMEYPAFSMISRDAQEKALVVAHETAHQWWYAAVGNNQFEHAWMDEGLAEYSAALFLEAYPSYGYRSAELVSRAESSYRTFFSVRSQLCGEADTTMNRPLTAFSGEYEYGNIAYYKSMLLFDRLRLSIGDRRFYSGLKEYAEKYRFRIAAPEDLISCFYRTGSGAEGLFDSFLNGKCVI